MVRVLHVFGRLDRGGAESLTMDIYRNIDRTKVQFDFIVHTNDVCDYEEEANSLGASFFRLPRFTGKNFFAYRKAWRAFLAQSREYNAVHIHVTNFAFVFLPLLKNIPIRIAHSHNTSDSSAVKRMLVRATRQCILRRATHYFAASRMAADFAYGKNAKDITVVPNAIDARAFAYNPEQRRHMREELKLDGKFVVGHVGRMHVQKNHPYLLQVVKVLQAKDPDAVLLLAGDGPLRGDIERRAAEMDVTTQFLGSRGDVRALMQAMDVFVLPSLFEGLPVVAIEAQAAGLPCLFSNTITRECAVVPELCEFLPINDPPEIWADTILSRRGDARRATIEEIKRAGFDARERAVWYERFYGNGGERS